MDEINPGASGSVQDPPDNAGTPATGTGAGDSSPPASWIDTLPDDLKGHETLKGYSTVDDLAKAHVEALGKIPSVPDKAEAYDIKPLDGLTVDESFLAQVKTWGHEAKLSQDQLATIAGRYMEAQKAYVAEVQAQADADLKAANAALKKEWGKEYDANVAKANKVMRMATEQDAQYIKESGLGADPAFIRLMQRIGELVSDDTLERGGTSAGAGAMKRTAGGMPQLDFPSMRK